MLLYHLLPWLLVTRMFVCLGDSSAFFASCGRFLFRLVCRFLGRFFVFRSLLFLSSYLFCRLIFPFFYRFLGLLSRRFCCRLLGRLFGRILGRLICLFRFPLFFFFFFLRSVVSFGYSCLFIFFCFLVLFLIFFGNLVSFVG